MTAEHKRACPTIPEHVKRFHLLGCCGTGMGALGVLLCESGYEVSGSDVGFYPPMSDILAHSGIRTMQGWEASHLDGLDPQDTIVVVGNFCRRTNEECQAALSRGFTALSQPETLYHFYLKRHLRRVVVSGTHGKTTTSSLIASILSSAGRDPSVFIGGQVMAYGCGAHLGSGGDFVVEGDEYDTAWFDKVPKFWHYAPTHLCINNIEFDHADIYENIEEIEQVFVRLVESMPTDGCIVYNADDARVRGVVASARCRAIGFSLENQETAAYNVENVTFYEGGIRFEMVECSTRRRVLLTSPLTGRHNAYNAAMAAIMSHELGVSDEDILGGLGAYQGVKKRQELIGIADGVTIYDDFAHHPTAVRETVRAIRARHPSSRLWGIFEMKSNTSRRSIFQEAYPEALSECDEVILSAPWKKDDLPPEMLINIPKVVEALNANGISARLIADVDDIVSALVSETKSGDVVLGMSGSAFGGLHRKVWSGLKQREEMRR